jgi:hypothetical protein
MYYVVNLEGRFERNTHDINYGHTHLLDSNRQHGGCVPRTNTAQDDEDTDAVKDFGEDEDDYKFGLCADCECGLDDRSEFVVHTYTGGETALLCLECHRFPCPWNPIHYRQDGPLPVLPSRGA